MRGYVLFAILVCTIVIVEGKKKEKDCSGVKQGKPICDQNGNTYSSLCEFKKTQKALKKKSVALEKTRCPKATTARPKVSKLKPRKITKKNNKKAEKAAKKMEKCMKPCPPGKNITVCASNVTYPDYCQYKRARCKAQLSGVKLIYYYKGSCGDPKACETHRQKMRKGVCNPDGTQSIKGFSVCANDGKTYHWPCEFLRAKCSFMKSNPGKELEVKAKRQSCDD